MDFFLLSFVVFFFCLFVFFVILCLVFCWFWGTGLTVSFALFIVICLFFFFKFIFILFIFFFIFIFFYFHGFSGFIFCKFDCSWHFFTSSDRVPLGGVGCTGAPFRGLVSRVSKLYKWWFGRASGLVDMELMKWYRGNGWRWVGKTIPGRGAVSGCSSPLAGHGWTIWEMVSIALFFFSYLLKIHGDWWLRDLFCLLQGAVKAPRLGSEFHSAFWNIIPVTTPIELRRLLMLPRRKERGETSPKILLNCWVGVVKIPLCSDGLENGVKCSKIE